MKATIKWATPDADAQILYIARVSNPANQDSTNTGLLNYCILNGHVSPFEMANACLMIETTRDIGRQIIRHRSFSFQEFSQRYADATLLGELTRRECRLQDKKNRQNSLECNTPIIADAWQQAQDIVADTSLRYYEWALQAGIAKEQARALLPEGLTMSRMYMNGTMRSWVHYLTQRLDPSTQTEQRELAQAV